ncbi:MAG: helix-turn-helix domain-containing protein, partial [Candidatus Nitrosopolaris sp.]
QKVKGRTYQDIANEHGVSSRSVQRWVAAFSRGGIDEIKLKKPSGLKSSITSRLEQAYIAFVHIDKSYAHLLWLLRKRKQKQTRKIRRF